MSERKQPSEYFVFEAQASGQDPKTETVVFAAGRAADADHLVERLRNHHLTHAPPERVILMGSDESVLLSLAGDSALRETLPSVTRYVDPPDIEPVAFDRSGTLTSLVAEAATVSAVRRQKIMRCGLMTIFDKRQGMLTAGPGYHYVNPSRRHTKAFIRTGNVLLHSAEVAFIAMGLLEWCPAGTRRIFTDTASINAVGYALADLCMHFDPHHARPTIDSFSSYGGLDRFDFDESESFCVVSASTSGNLEARLTSTGLLPADRIATLFYCGPALDGRRILCDITEREGVDDGHALIESYASEGDCKLCRQGSATIHISGDQFLPADPEVDEILISQDHEPTWLAPLLTDLLGTGAVRCNTAIVGDAARFREISIDLSKIADDAHGSPLAARIQKRLLSATPVALERVVHLNDASSKALAETVARHYARHNESASDGLVISELVAREDPTSLVPAGGAIMVVAGVVSTGRALLSVSQFLRSVEDLGHLSYLIGVGRVATPRDWRRLRENLTFGTDPGEYPLLAVRLCHLPDDSGPDASPWRTEERYWETTRDDIAHSSEQAAAALDQRRDILNGVVEADRDGLTDQLFLPAVRQGGGFDSTGRDGRLELRKGFVFWRSVARQHHADPETSATQSEVYLTIAAVLHELRQSHPDGRALVQHEHNRTVLGPSNFARFNDGVIQASLLRAARQSELDYSASRKLSAEMQDIVLRFAKRCETKEGEAFPEFLLALARGRLRLHAMHEHEVAQALMETRGRLPPLLAALVERFERRLDWRL
ncbi:MAG: hypothetical protein WD993_08785 [Thermoleophilaceae bacterium]